MILSAADLFTLFNQSCKAVGAPGYTGAWQNQSSSTIKAFTAFAQSVARYWPANDGGEALISAPTPTKVSEDAMRKFYEGMDEAGRLKHYRYLNALGCRM